MVLEKTGKTGKLEERKEKKKQMRNITLVIPEYDSWTLIVKRPGPMSEYHKQNHRGRESG